MADPRRWLEFVWLPAFERSAAELLRDEDRRELERELVEDPSRGAVVPGTGGVRKMRLGRGARGKSGGVRIVYWHSVARGRIYLLLAYAKADQSDLTAGDRAAIAKLVRRLEEEERHGR